MKKIEMSKEEYELYLELQKMVKTANQRIIALERTTGIKESFSIKQLIDYLSSKPLMAVTEGGRISLKKTYTLMQLKAIKKATEEFLSKDESKVRGIKEYVKEYSKIAGKKLSFKMANTWYQVTHDLEWLYDENLTPSIFWKNFAPQVNNKSKETWVGLVIDYKAKSPDRTIKRNLEMLYDYLKNG